MEMSELQETVEQSALEGQIGALVRRDFLEGEQPNDGKPISDGLCSLVQGINVNAIREIDRLITELQICRDKLRLEGERVERELWEYTTLNKSVMEATKIIEKRFRDLKIPSDKPRLSIPYDVAHVSQAVGTG